MVAVSVTQETYKLQEKSRKTLSENRQEYCGARILARTTTAAPQRNLDTLFVSLWPCSERGRGEGGMVETSEQAWQLLDVEFFVRLSILLLQDLFIAQK